MSLPPLIVGTRHCRVLYIIPMQPETISSLSMRGKFKITRVLSSPTEAKKLPSGAFCASLSPHSKVKHYVTQESSKLGSSLFPQLNREEIDRTNACPPPSHQHSSANNPAPSRNHTRENRAGEFALNSTKLLWYPDWMRR